MTAFKLQNLGGCASSNHIAVFVVTHACQNPLQSIENLIQRLLLISQHVKYHFVPYVTTVIWPWKYYQYRSWTIKKYKQFIRKSYKLQFADLAVIHSSTQHLMNGELYLSFVRLMVWYLSFSLGMLVWLLKLFFCCVRFCVGSGANISFL